MVEASCTYKKLQSILRSKLLRVVNNARARTHTHNLHIKNQLNQQKRITTAVNTGEAYLELILHQYQKPTKTHHPKCRLSSSSHPMPTLPRPPQHYHTQKNCQTQPKKTEVEICKKKLRRRRKLRNKHSTLLWSEESKLRRRDLRSWECVGVA